MTSLRIMPSQVFVHDGCGLPKWRIERCPTMFNLRLIVGNEAIVDIFDDTPLLVQQIVGHDVFSAWWVNFTNAFDVEAYGKYHQLGKAETK